MQLKNKLLYSQQKFINNFIHNKPVIYNIIKIVKYYLMELLGFNEP